MFIDARKAYLIPRCEGQVYIELPEECGLGEGYCGKLNFLLCGFRPAAAAWEKHYAELFEGVGLNRGISCGVVFYHEGKDLSLAVHGDDFTFCGLEEVSVCIRELMEGWFEKNARRILGPDEWDDKENIILGRKVRWGKERILYEADEKHMELVLDDLGFEG